MIELLNILVPVFISLGQTINKTMQKAKQAGELTPEKEAEFQAQLETVFSQDYAQPRPLHYTREGLPKDYVPPKDSGK